jgi:hypothetical protein
VKMEVTPGAKPDTAVVYALLSGNESALWAMDGYDAAATLLLNRPLSPSTANVTTTSFAIRNSVLYVLTSDGIVTREPLTAAGLPSSGGSASSFNLTQLVYAASCQVSLAQARPVNSSMPSRAVPRSSLSTLCFLTTPRRLLAGLWEQDNCQIYGRIVIHHRRLARHSIHILRPDPP